MKRTSFIQKIFAFAFTVIVLFSVSVRETHYLFVEHHPTDAHCENHLHSGDAHPDCSFCKFDVSFFTNSIFYPPIGEQKFSDENIAATCQPVICFNQVSSNPLRGPPIRV